MKSKGITWLESAIPPEQYRYLRMFVDNPELYQDIGRDPTKDKKKGKSPPLMQEAIDLASRNY